LAAQITPQQFKLRIAPISTDADGYEASSSACSLLSFDALKHAILFPGEKSGLGLSVSSKRSGYFLCRENPPLSDEKVSTIGNNIPNKIHCWDKELVCAFTY